MRKIQSIPGLVLSADVKVRDSSDGGAAPTSAASAGCACTPVWAAPMEFATKQLPTAWRNATAVHACTRLPPEGAVACNRRNHRRPCALWLQAQDDVKLSVSHNLASKASKLGITYDTKVCSLLSAWPRSSALLRRNTPRSRAALCACMRSAPGRSTMPRLVKRIGAAPPAAVAATLRPCSPPGRCPSRSPRAHPAPRPRPARWRPRRRRSRSTT